MTTLHIFDMDGTLLRGSACLEISHYMGVLDDVNVIEEAWDRGEVDHVSFYEQCLPLWTGLTESGIDALFEASPWYEGISAVWADIAARGEQSAVLTLSPQFFAERLKRWGAGTVHGAEVFAGQQPNPALVMTPERKVKVAEELMQRYALSEDDCVAYGDSFSDGPLFERLPHTVAINGSERIREIATAVYDGTDLRQAYAVGRGLIDAYRGEHVQSAEGGPLQS